jgi:hypothetical protein
LINAVYETAFSCEKVRVSTRQLIDKEVSDLPEPLQLEVYNFARSLKQHRTDESFNGLLLSESSLAKDWNTPEEDAAWANL